MGGSESPEVKKETRDRSSQKSLEAKVLRVKEGLRGFIQKVSEKSIFVKKILHFLKYNKKNKKISYKKIKSVKICCRMKIKRYFFEIVKRYY
jgi:hypothetical protein